MRVVPRVDRGDSGRSQRSVLGEADRGRRGQYLPDGTGCPGFFRSSVLAVDSVGMLTTAKMASIRTTPVTDYLQKGSQKRPDDPNVPYHAAQFSPSRLAASS